MLKYHYTRSFFGIHLPVRVACKPYRNSFSKLAVSRELEEERENLEIEESPLDNTKKEYFRLLIKAHQFPKGLQSALIDYFENMPCTLNELRADIQHLHGGYFESLSKSKGEKIQRRAEFMRHHFEKQRVQDYGPRETMAFIASEMASTYACTHQVLTDLKQRCCEFKPTSLLDFGSGPGTVMWSAHQLWGDTLRHNRLVEVSDAMNHAAKDLVIRAEKCRKESDIDHRIPSLESARFQHYLSEDGSKDESDLVVSAYTLSQLPTDAIRMVILRELWRRTKDTLVFVENGTPEGFRHILNAREYLLELSSRDPTGSHIFAPCPHDGVCPLMEAKDTICSFKQRTILPVQIMHLQKLKRPQYDTRYSYIVIRRGSRKEATEKTTFMGMPRVMSVLKKTQDSAKLDVCTPEDGLQRFISSKNWIRRCRKPVRKLKVGHLWPFGSELKLRLNIK